MLVSLGRFGSIVLLLLLEHANVAHSLLTWRIASRNSSSVQTEETGPVRLISTVNLLRDFENATHLGPGENMRGLRGELRNPALQGLAKEILQLCSPSPDAVAHCTKRDDWDQYVICQGLLEGRKTEAHSYGVKGYDMFGAHVAKAPYKMPVHLYDCFDPSKPKNFPNMFHNTCVAAKPSVDKSGRHFETMHQHLSHLDDLSAFVKLDIEGAEFDVLESLEDDAARKIAMLTVEYHSGLGGCGEILERRHTTELAPCLRRVDQFFSVVEGYGVFWGQPCNIDGYHFPQVLAVTYINKRFLKSS